MIYDIVNSTKEIQICVLILISFLKILSSEKQLNLLVSQPEELDFVYDSKIANEIKKSAGIFEKFVS